MIADTVFGICMVWLLWELASQLVSHPVSEDGEPLRGPISVADYLWYNPGVHNS